MYKFCPECGAKLSGGKFCSECGARLSQVGGDVPAQGDELGEALSGLDELLAEQKKQDEKRAEYDKLRVLIIRGKYDEAAAMCDKLLDENPMDAAAYISLVRIASQNYKQYEGDKIDEAIRVAQEVFAGSDALEKDGEYSAYIQERARRIKSGVDIRDGVLVKYKGKGGSVVVPDGVTAIADRAFEGCRGLSEITIPDSVTSIGECAFCGCSGLAGIEIPDSVESIGFGAFSGCSGLTSMTIPFVGASRKSTNEAYSMQFGYIFGTDSYEGGTETAQTQASASACNNYYIPTALRSVTVLGGSLLFGAFSNCRNLASVTLRDGVVNIGSNAFWQCVGLKTIKIPNSVTNIGSLAFCGCAGLIGVKIGGGVTSIGSQAFYNCVGLNSIEIPDGVTSIGDYTFGCCTSLTSVVIGSGVTSIGVSAFTECKSLGKIVMPSSVRSIGNYAIYNSSPIVEFAGTQNEWNAISKGSYAVQGVREVRFNVKNTVSSH